MSDKERAEHAERAYYKLEAEVINILAPKLGFKRWCDLPELSSTCEGYFIGDYSVGELCQLAAQHMADPVI